jgi:hypothetical protein
MYDSPAFTKFESPFEEQGEFEEKYIGLRDIAGRRRSSGRRGHTNGPVGRTRIRRNPTTPENANFSCQICGRLFQRSYNLKSHLQTHNPTRPHPNHCPYPGCERRFVRRTDLLRHEQSVSLSRLLLGKLLMGSLGAHQGSQFQVLCVRCTLCAERYPSEVSYLRFNTELTR